MKKIILPILILFISTGVFAQRNSDKFKKLKIPFISERLDLTSEEAEKFWPIYNEYEDVSSHLRHEIHGIEYKIKKNAKDMSNQKAKQLLFDLSNYEAKRLEANNKLIKDLLEILPPKKVLLLKAAEGEFKKRLFDRYVEKKLKSRKD